MRGGDEFCEYMGIGQKGVHQTLQKQSELITRTPITNTQAINLNKELNLDYKI